MSKTLAERMYLRSGERLLLAGAPAGYAAALAPPDGVAVSDDPTGSFDVIQVFLSTCAALEAELPHLKPLDLQHSDRHRRRRGGLHLQRYASRRG